MVLLGQDRDKRGETTVYRCLSALVTLSTVAASMIYPGMCRGMPLYGLAPEALQKL